MNSLQTKTYIQSTVFDGVYHIPQGNNYWTWSCTILSCCYCVFHCSNDSSQNCSGILHRRVQVVLRGAAALWYLRKMWNLLTEGHNISLLRKNKVFRTRFSWIWCKILMKYCKIIVLLGLPYFQDSKTSLQLILRGGINRDDCFVEDSSCVGRRTCS